MPLNRPSVLFAAALPAMLVVGYMHRPAISLDVGYMQWPAISKEIERTLEKWRHGVSSPHEDVMAYDTGRVTRGEIRKVVTGTGIVKPLVSVLVGSQLSGQIAELKASFNSEVKAGDVLATLDDASFASRVTQARAELALAQSALLNQEAALAKAQALYEHAEKTSERQNALVRSRTTTASSVDAAERDVLVAKSEIEIAKAQIAGAKSTVAHREAQLEQALIDLEHTKIRAPISGIVLSRLVEVGQTVAASLQSPELFRIAQNLTRIQIEAQIGEAEIGGVKQGNPVSFTVDAFPEDRFAGEVSAVRLAPNIDQNIVTYTVVIDVDNADLRLYPGMTATVKIETAKRENVARVPLDALRFAPEDVTAEQGEGQPAGPREKSVWVQNGPGGELQARPIRVGLSDGRYAEIAEGDLPEGSDVVLRRQQPAQE